MNQRKREHERDRDREREHVGAVKDHAREPEHGVVLVEQVCDADRRPAVPQQAHVLEDEREPDRGDQRRELRRARSGRYPTRSISTLSEPHTSIEITSVTEQPEHQTQWSGREPEPKRRPQPDRRERADHEHVAVGEVDQLDDPVDERVPHRHQRPDRAVREPRDEIEAQLREVVVDDRVTGGVEADLVPVHQVAHGVVGGQRQQRHDQPPAPDVLA